LAVDSKIALEVKNISKRYNSLKALDNVCMTFDKGKVTSIYGPNGAGKSTLVKIICGVENRDSGIVLLNNCEVSFKRYKDAVAKKITYVPQDLGLVSNLTGLENLAFTLKNKRGSFLYKKHAIIDFLSLKKELLFPFRDNELEVKDLSEYQKQVLVINKAILANSEVLIFDESTTNFNDFDFELFKKIVGKLKELGKTIIFISHKIKEVYSISIILP
jgi:ribose transport system ATP-binding protein